MIPKQDQNPTANKGEGVATMSVANIIKDLSRHTPYNRMDKDDLKRLANHLRYSRYAPGDLVLVPGPEEPKEFFIIAEGCILGEPEQARVGDESLRQELCVGECFPLAALLTNRPVTSAFRAREATACYRLERANFERLLERSLVFQDYCRRRTLTLLEHSRRALRDLTEPEAAGQSLQAPLGSLLQRQPVTCPLGTTLGKAIDTMHAQDVGSIVILDKRGAPAGIFTLRDLRNRLVYSGCNLTESIDEVMQPDPITLLDSAPAFEAMLTMVARGIHHIVVTRDDQVVGVVSEKTLFALQRLGATRVAETIRLAPSLERLIQSAADIRLLARNLIAQGVNAQHITEIITSLNDSLTRRVIQLELERTRPGEIEFCWMALGSQGRCEQTLVTDQDNGLIFRVPHGETEKSVRKKLLPFAEGVNAALDACGFSLCKGGVMASNPKWCLSLEEWQGTFGNWIHRGDRPALLHATIFFDFRPLYGIESLCTELRHWLNTTIKENWQFLRKMAENAIGNAPPLGLVRDFVVESKGEHQHTLDLKLNGITPFVDAARIFSLRAGVSETNTLARLRAAGRAWNMEATEIEAWVSALLFIQQIRLRHQSENKDPLGSGSDNRMNPDWLNDLDRRILKEAFRQARKLQSLLENFFSF